MKLLFEKIYKGKFDDFLKDVSEKLVNQRKMFVVTANPEIFALAETDIHYRHILESPETTIVADGIGIVKGASFLGIEISERIPGVELVESLFVKINSIKGRICLLGAKEDVLSKLIVSIQEKYPLIEIVYATSGYGYSKEEFKNAIIEHKPDLILVALGAPNQEKLIDQIYGSCDKGIFIGVGGSFDVLSGYKQRAPKIYINMHLEWAYRLLKEPNRIKRFVKSNTLYLKELFKIKNK